MKHLLLAIMMLCSSPAWGKNVLVTISPIFSLVKSVSGDLNNVELLISSNASPHHYQLKPSDAKKIRRAEIIFMVGKDFELFLNGRLNAAEVVTLIDSKGLTLLPSRSSGHHGDVDLHFWGNPRNAEVITNKIADVLSEADPANKLKYEANALKTVRRLSEMDVRIKTILSDVRSNSFLTLHDGYQYFERYYDLKNVGIIKSGHDKLQGARTLHKISDIIKQTSAQCVLAEPHFASHFIQKISEMTGTKIGYVNIESFVPNNTMKPEDIYFFMMEQNARNIAACF